MVSGPNPFPQPDWKYVSIDIETLGLDEETCDTIEVGAVLDDYKTPLEELPRFHCYVTRPNDEYKGTAFAMAMHSEILKRIANRVGGFDYTPFDLVEETFWRWLRRHGVPADAKVVVAGKNFSGFDQKFLNKIGFGKIPFFHRVIDPGSMFFKPGKEDKPPGLEECLRRAGIDKKVNHTAVEDALDVIRCIRYKSL